MEKTEGFLELADVSLYYQIFGSGLPLVMLHGNRQSHKAFDTQARILSQGYQVILVDSRGHGRSDMGQKRLTITQMAHDLEAMRQQLGLERLILFGYSDGGNVALRYASAHPDHTLAIIAISPNARFSGLKFWMQLLLRMQVRIYRAFRYLHIAIRHGMHLSELMTKYSHISRTDLQKITAPTLILSGGRDIVSAEHSAFLGDYIADAHVYIMPKATHFSLFVKPKRYMRFIQHFLQLQKL